MGPEQRFVELVEEWLQEPLFLRLFERAMADCQRSGDPSAFDRFRAMVRTAMSEISLRESLEGDEMLARVILPRLERELGAVLLTGEEQTDGGELISLWARRSVEAELDALLDALAVDAAQLLGARSDGALADAAQALAARARGETDDLQERLDALEQVLFDESDEWLYEADALPSFDAALRQMLSRSGHAAWAAHTAAVAASGEVRAAVAARFAAALGAMSAAVDPALADLQEAGRDLKEPDWTDPAALDAFAEKLHRLQATLAVYQGAVATLPVALPAAGDEVQCAVEAVKIDESVSAPLPSQAEAALRVMVLGALREALGDE